MLERAIEIEERVGVPHPVSVPLSKLNLVAKYQRALNVGQVRRMTQEWNPNAFGVLYVSERRPGYYVVIDGQHRVVTYRAVADGAYDPVVPCLVYKGLTPQEEAFLFKAYNGGRTKPGAADMFNAALEAEDPDALGIVRVVESFGLKVARGGGRDGIITAIHMLEEVWRLGGETRLTTVLRILSKAYGKAREAYANGILRGLDVFLERYETEPAYSEGHLIDALRRVDPMEFYRKAHILGHGTRPDTNAALHGRIFLDAYNKGRRGASVLMPWDDPRMTARAKGRGAVYGSDFTERLQAQKDLKARIKRARGE